MVESQGNDPSTKTGISSIETLSCIILYTLIAVFKKQRFNNIFGFRIHELKTLIVCTVHEFSVNVKDTFGGFIFCI